MQYTEKLFMETMEDFQVQSQSFVLDGTEWDTIIDNEYKTLSQAFRQTITDMREKEVEKLFKLTKDNIVDQISGVINDPIFNLEDNMWDCVTKGYVKYLKRNQENYKIILDEGFKCDEEEYDTQIEKLELAVYENSVVEIRRLSRDLNSHLNRKFGELFKKDKEGKFKNWKTTEEADIHLQWKDAKSVCDQLFEEFRFIKLPKRLKDHVFVDEEPDFEETKREPGVSFSSLYDSLLLTEELNKIKDQFNKDCEHAVDEAIRSHHNLGSGAIPKWAIVMFIFFAYDDILAYVGHPIIFYPLIVVLGVFGILQSVGMGSPALLVIRHSINMSLRNFGVGLQI